MVLSIEKINLLDCSFDVEFLKDEKVERASKVKDFDR